MTTTLLTEWEERLTAITRSQRLYTTHVESLYGKKPPTGETRPTATCPYCLQGVDDAYHALNTCRVWHAHKERVLRHDNVVCKMATAALQHDHAGHLLVWDARSTCRKPRQPGATKLPVWILPHCQQHSIPDICRISLPAGFVGPHVTAEQRRTSVITIVEVKYAPDPDIQRTVRQKAKDQHSALKSSLEANGWGRVTIYPVIIGNAGTITATAHAALQALGVGTAARTRLLPTRSVDRVRTTAPIWKPKLVKCKGQQPQPVPAPEPNPRPESSVPAGAGMDASHLDNHDGQYTGPRPDVCDATHETHSHAVRVPDTWQTVTRARNRPQP